MIHRVGVLCAKETKVLPFEVNVDTVYRRYNIESYVGPTNEEGWKYDEDELTLVEYLKEAVPENQELTNEALGELTILLTLYQQEIQELKEALKNVQ